MRKLENKSRGRHIEKRGCTFTWPERRRGGRNKAAVARRNYREIGRVMGGLDHGGNRDRVKVDRKEKDRGKVGKVREEANGYFLKKKYITIKHRKICDNDSFFHLVFTLPVTEVTRAKPIKVSFLNMVSSIPHRLYFRSILVSSVGVFNSWLIWFYSTTIKNERFVKVHHYHTHMLLLIILTTSHLNMKSLCMITFKNMVLS